jgi:hypothetical protein
MPIVWSATAVAVVLVLAGIVLFAKAPAGGGGKSRIKLPGLEAEVPVPSLALVVLGCGLLIFAMKNVPQDGGDHPAVKESSLAPEPQNREPQKPALQQPPERPEQSPEQPQQKPSKKFPLDVQGVWIIDGGQGSRFSLTGSPPNYTYAGYNALGVQTEIGTATLRGNRLHCEADNTMVGVHFSCDLQAAESQMRGSLIIPGRGMVPLSARR